jgi:hypothetical protein
MSHIWQRIANMFPASDYQCNLSMESYMNEEKIETEIAHHEARV